MPDETKLYLIRHGATPENEKRPRILQGCGIDNALSETGRGQAKQVADYLKSFQVDAVFSSPLRRAVETAEAIASHHDLAVQTIEQIHEVEVGQWQSLDWGTIEREFPEAYACYMQDSGKHGYLGGESCSDVLNRTSPAFDKLLRDNIGRTIAVVAHTVVNRTWLSSLLGIDLHRAKDLPQDNCCINVIRYRDGHTQLVTLNSTLHLC